MQLDFFDGSQIVALRNDVIFALLQCDEAKVQIALDRLQQGSPDDDCLAPMRVLRGVLAERTKTPLKSHDELARASCQLQQEITPAAIHSLGAADAARWLQQRWAELAARAVRLPFCAEYVDEHAAVLWMYAGQWQAAVDAVALIESWWRIPAPLSWMLHARLRLQGVQANWGILAELAWLAPLRLHAVIQTAAEPILQRLTKQFEAEFEDAGDASGMAWLPAWMLTKQPGLATAFRHARAGLNSAPEQAMRLMLELLGLEHQGRQREMIAHRKVLRDLNADLYAAYMAAR